MDRNTAEKILEDAMHADQNIRSKAENTMKSFLQRDFPGFLTTFGQIMLDDTFPLKLRHISSIVIKNTFHSKNSRIQRGFEQNWLQTSETIRNAFITLLQSNLNVPETAILENIARILGSIIRIECSRQMNNRHFKKLYEILADRRYALGALRATSIACDQLYDETEYDFKDEMYDIFYISMQYFNESNLPENFLKAVFDCIYSSVDIYSPIFKDKTAKNNFLFRLTEYARRNDPVVVEKALEVMNRFISACHEELVDELPDIYQVYVSCFALNDELIHFQVIEFLKLMLELNYDRLVAEKLPFLLPILFALLKKEEPEDTELSAHKAICNLLTALAGKFKSNILNNEVSKKFIFEKLQSPNSEERAIGAVALGCICEVGASEFSYQTIEFLLNDLGNEETVHESLFALSKICEKNMSSTINYLPAIIEKCGILISSSSSAAASAAWVYNSLFMSIKDKRSVEAQNILNFHYTDILGLLVNKLNSMDPSDYDLRNALICAFSELIGCCPDKLRNVLENLNTYLVSKVRETLVLISSSTNENIFIIEDILSNYIVILTFSLELTPNIDKGAIVELFISILQSPENKSHGETFISISTLISKISDGLKYFIPFIIKGIESQDNFVSKSALNCLSDCATQLEKGIGPYISTVIPALVSTIASTNTPLSFKPLVIETFGHIALAIGRKFEPFLEMVLVLFEQINSLNRVGDEDYVDKLRKSVVQLFSYIVVSVGCTNELMNKLPTIIRLLESAVASDVESSYVSESIDLICDIRGTFGLKYIQYDWIVKFLNKAMASKLSFEKSNRMLMELQGNISRIY